MALSPAVSPPSSDRIALASRFLALAGQVEAANSALLANPDGTVEVDAARRLLAESIDAAAGFPSKQRNGDEAKELCRLVQTVLKAGWVDAPAGPGILAAAEKLYDQGWNKLLAALLYAPAWQQSLAPDFAKVPLFIWPALAASYLRLPGAFVALGQADAAARQYVRRLGELVAAAEGNPGSQAVRAAAAACEEAGCFGVLRGSSTPLHQVLALRGRLRAALSRKAVSESVVPQSREWRNMRLGVVIQSLADDPLTRMARPWFEALDTRRFEVSLFVLGDGDPQVEADLSARGFVPRRLFGDTDAQAGRIRDEAFDCVMFVTRATDPSDPVSRILDHRVAALQVVVEESGGTSGLVQADAVFVENAGDVAARSLHYTEQVLVVPASGIRLPSLAGEKAAARAWSREGLGLSEGAVLFSSTAPFANISPEWADSAGLILGWVAGSKLLVHSNAPQDSGPAGLSRICSTLAPAMARHGIDADRLIVSNEAIGGLRELGALLRVADVHLDAFPSTDFEGSALAFGSGIPVVTGRPPGGFDTRTSDALAKLGLADCIGRDGGEFAEVATRLGCDPRRRTAIRSALPLALARDDSFNDPVVFADSVGAVLAKAFDLSFDGRPPGRGGRRPPIVLDPVADPKASLAEVPLLIDSGLFAEASKLLCKVLASEPGCPGARAMYYKAMIDGGSGNRAAIGVVEAAERGVGGAGTWLQLAKIRFAQDRQEEALGALRRSLELAPRDLEAWFLMKTFAEARGASGLGEEIDRMIAGIRGEPMAAPIPPGTRKSLYFSPVGRNGKAILSRLLTVFPRDRFDFLIIAYDDTDFSDLGDGIRVIRDRGQKWGLAKRHLTPELVANYEYVFIWDDDIAPATFNAETYLDILRRNSLDIAQPSLSADSYIFHPITANRGAPVGRLTNFVEIMCPAYSSRIWPAIYAYIDPEINELGWGYDYIPLGRKGVIDCMSVHHTRPGQSKSAGAEEQCRAWCLKHKISSPAFKEISHLN